MRSVDEWYGLRGRAEVLATESESWAVRCKAAAVVNVLVWLTGRSNEDPLGLGPTELCAAARVMREASSRRRGSVVYEEVD